MKETISLTFQWMQAYFDNEWHWLLFLAAFILLLFFKESSDKNRIFFYYGITILIIYFCPVTAWIIMNYCIGTDTYWRMLWLLPMVPVLAYVLVLLIQHIEQKGRIAGIAAIVLSVVLIAVSGTNLYTSGQFVDGNRFKLGDTMMAISNFLDQYNTDEEIYAAIPPEFMNSIRQYNAEIKQPYGRYGPKNWQRSQKKIYEVYTEQPQNFKKLASACNKLGINYIVYTYSEKAETVFEQYGYQLAGTITTYGIFHNPEHGSADE